MNSFNIWFSIGWQHILDLGGYDHLLFVCLLAFAFPPKEWKSLLILITAFTIGHSLSLIFSVLSKHSFSSAFIEPAIAFSILFTALYQLLSSLKSQKSGLLYLSTLFFGLLHGMGFSFLLRSLLGNEQSVFLPLLYFNLGIEAGQLFIVLLIVGISLLLNSVFNIRFNPINTTLTCLIALIALYLFVSRLYALF